MLAGKSFDATAKTIIWSEKRLGGAWKGMDSAEKRLKNLGNCLMVPRSRG